MLDEHVQELNEKEEVIKNLKENATKLTKKPEKLFDVKKKYVLPEEK